MSYETQIVWSCSCGESGIAPLMNPDDNSGRLLLLRNTHRQERGCKLVAEVKDR